MRVISGKFKGRRLVGFKAPHIRPTTDRIKESMFNKMAPDLPQARVLDLFSGTGNLAIEALSRGADYVEAVEKSPKSLAIIKKNFTSLGIKDEIKLIQSDVVKYLKAHKGEAFDVIFVDPPFTQKMADEVMEALSLSSVGQNGSRVVIESGGHEKISDTYGAYLLEDRKLFGDKSVSYYRKEQL